MSADWQVGDLAAFVGPRDYDDADRGMVIGRVYTVSAYFMGPDSGLPCLLFAEGIDPSPWAGWKPECFRKIRPDEHEPCEEEFVKLLDRSKQPERLPMTAALSRFGDVPSAFVEAEIEFERKYAELQEWVRARG